MSNKKYNIEGVSKYISMFKYTLLSKEYTNTKNKLIIMCDKGHVYYTSFTQFKRGDRCKICSCKDKYTYTYVKNYIEKEGYGLLSSSYSHGKEMLMFICDKGHKYMGCFNNFQQGRRCPECKPKYSKAEKELFNFIKASYGGTILENDRSVVKNPKTGNMLELDIYLPEAKIAFEYNGKYWHTNDESKYRDRQKIIQCKNKGINLIIIDENDWIHHKSLLLDDIYNILKRG